MYNQGPSIGRIDPINVVNTRPPPDPNAFEKSGMRQFYPPPYQDYHPYPNVRYLPPGSYPGPYGHPAQHYGAPGGHQGPYSQDPYPFHQGPLPGHPGVTVQPTMFTSPTPQSNPKPDYMCYSVFTLLCCCLPLGIGACIYSVATQEANRSGQRDVAERSSRTALRLNNAALGIGLTVYAVAIVCFILIFTNVIK